jgi:hypothetical protein
VTVTLQGIGEGAKRNSTLQRSPGRNPTRPGLLLVLSASALKHPVSADWRVQSWSTDGGRLTLYGNSLARGEPRPDAQSKKVIDELEDQGIPVRFRPCRLVCRRSARRGECFAFHSPDGNTHFQDVTVELRKTNFAPPAPPIHIGSDFAASKTFFGGFDAGWGAHDLENRLNHPTPATQFGIVLQGIFSITTTDGETRRLRPGSVFRLEDTSPCKGHITVVGDETGFLMFVR